MSITGLYFKIEEYIEEYGEDLFIVLNKEEARPYLEDGVDLKEISSYKQHLIDIATGQFNGIYFSEKEEELAYKMKDYIKTILEKINFVEEVHDFGTSWEPSHLIIEGETILFLSKQIKIKKDYLKTSKEGFMYNSDLFERKIKAFFKTFGADVRRTYRYQQEQCIELEFVCKCNNSKVKEFVQKPLGEVKLS